METGDRGGGVVMNGDDKYVPQLGRDLKARVPPLGFRHPADVSAQNIQRHGSNGSTFDLVIDGVREPVMLPLLGEHNIYNALAATAAALERGISPSVAAGALGTVQAGDKRGQLLELDGATIINDCYNSNPKALNFMIDTLAGMNAQRRILVAGEMLELGPTGEKLHADAGRQAAEKKIDLVIGVRGLAKALVEAASAAGANARYVETPEEAGELLAKELRPGDA